MPQNNDLAFEIPSKTFIIGEYLAINGTASLLLATEPSFFVKVINDPRYGFHEQSPAGNLLRELKLKDIGFSFFDPHQGRGGFGRSTAEYLSLLMYEHHLNNGNPQDFTESTLSHLEDVIQRYRKNCGRDYTPSGADLVAQLCGGLCWYDGMNYTAEKLAWPYTGYDIYIFHTGKKLATHDHLRDLKKMNLKPLIPLLIATRSALDHQNLRVFCEGLNSYYDTLNELGLSDSTVYESVQKLRHHPSILAAKGCGAMGVDTVLVIAEQSAAQEVRDLCSQEDFQWITSLSQVHDGAQVRRTV